MRCRLSGVAIVSCMALFFVMAGTSWGAGSLPVCLKKKSEIVNPDATNFLHGNWAILITDTDDGILETIIRLQFGDELRFFRHRFESGEPFGQPTLNFLHNRLCDALKDLSPDIAQAFGFPAGTTFVFKESGVRRGEVVPDENGKVGSNFPISDIEDLLIPESTFPLHYGAIYKVGIYKQPPL